MCFYYEGDVESISHRETIRVRRGSKSIRCEGAYSYGVCASCDFMRNEITLQEMEHGCKWHEAWCPLEELQTEIKERKLQRQSRDWCQERLRLTKPPRKKRTKKVA